VSELAIGIVGCGKIARDQHLPAIAAVSGLTAVAIADPYVTHPLLPSYGDLSAMLAAHPEIGAVALCQPPQARFAAAREAIQAGRHVFLEKPPGGTVSEAEALVRLAREAGVTLFTAWHSREGAAVAAAKHWLAGRALQSVRIRWKEDVRVWHPGQKWIWQPGGFGVFDPGINALSILTEIMPDAVRLTAAELTFPANWQAPIAADLEMETLGGVPIHAEFDFRQTGPQSWDIEIEAADGAMRLGDGGNIWALDGAAQSCPPQQEYSALYRRFAALIAKGGAEADLAPLRLVADAFLIGRRLATVAFED